MYRQIFKKYHCTQLDFLPFFFIILIIAARFHSNGSFDPNIAAIIRNGKRVNKELFTCLPLGWRTSPMHFSLQGKLGILLNFIHRIHILDLRMEKFKPQRVLNKKTHFERLTSASHDLRFCLYATVTLNAAYICIRPSPPFAPLLRQSGSLGC